MLKIVNSVPSNGNHFFSLNINLQANLWKVVIRRVILNTGKRKKKFKITVLKLIKMALMQSKVSDVNYPSLTICCNLYLTLTTCLDLNLTYYFLLKLTPLLRYSSATNFLLFVDTFYITLAVNYLLRWTNSTLNTKIIVL